MESDQGKVDFRLRGEVVSKEPSGNAILFFTRSMKGVGTGCERDSIRRSYLVIATERVNANDNGPTFRSAAVIFSCVPCVGCDEKQKIIQTGGLLHLLSHRS